MRSILLASLAITAFAATMCVSSLPLAFETEAAENATSVYLLGLRGPLAGIIDVAAKN